MNGEVPPQVDQVEQVLQVRQRFQGSHVPPQGDRSPNVEGGNEVPEISLIAIAQAMTSQINLTMVPRLNVVEHNMTSRFRDFVRLNIPTFLGSKVDDDPQKFLDGVYKVLRAMGLH